MTIQRRGRGGLDAVELRNAIAAENFRKLPDEIETWRFREVLTKLGTELRLSSGAVLYALDLMGMLTEADWRGDGRAVTFHSIRSYARKVGKSERTICEYERQLIMAGLIHRTVKHARRHGGQGCEARRTGLDWRAFGAAMPMLLDRLAERQAIERRRLDIEARIRAARHIVLGSINMMEEGRAVEALASYTDIGVARLRGTIPLIDLENRLARLILLQTQIVAEAVDNPPIALQTADQSEEINGLIDDTDHSSSPKEIRKGIILSTPDDILISVPDIKDQNGWGRKERDDVTALPLANIWKAAPAHWQAALGLDVAISWSVLIEIAAHIAPRLGVSPSVWGQAMRVLGPTDTAVALMVLDRNRDHPSRPVLSVGGALVGMVRRAERGELHLVPSVHGIMARTERSPYHAI